MPLQASRVHSRVVACTQVGLERRKQVERNLTERRFELGQGSLVVASAARSQYGDR